MMMSFLELRIGIKGSALRLPPARRAAEAVFVGPGIAPGVLA